MFVEIRDANLERYDVFIVGSGPAGTTLALQLAQRGRRVLILESGGRDYDAGVQSAFSSVYGRGHFDGIHWSSHWIRALGGTSGAWQGFCLPLLDRNMADWPIGRAELDPYYRIAARILGRDPTFLTFQQDHLDGFRLRPFSTEPPVHFGDPEFGVPEDDPMIDIALNTTLAGLRPRLDRQGVDGIAIWSPGGGRIEARVAETQSIVLAAGGVGNAQILLASTDGTSAAVGNEADQVGRYLMEHPHSYHCGRVVVPSELALPEAPEPFGAQVPALVPDDSLHAQIGGRDVSVEWVETAPNLNDPHEVFLLDRIGPAARSFFLNVRSEMAADPVNRLTIGEGRDPAGLPRLRARCVIGADDLRAIDLCLEALGGRLVANGPGRLRILNDALYRGVTGGGHIMGTTRMGDDPRRSVVNRDCRVHGYRNLFVAGSSVFATGGYENPTLTIMALAARLGDHLADAA